MREVLLNRIYVHFKGNEYRTLLFAKYAETGEKLVVYQALYGENLIYAKPYDVFISKVDKEKYPDMKQEYRFELKDGH